MLNAEKPTTVEEEELDRPYPERARRPNILQVTRNETHFPPTGTTTPILWPSFTS